MWGPATGAAFTSSTGAGAGSAGAMGAVRTLLSLRSLLKAVERFLRSLSLLKAPIRRFTTSSSIRVLGLSSISMFFVRKNSITVGTDTLRSFATLLIFVFAIYCVGPFSKCGVTGSG